MKAYRISGEAADLIVRDVLQDHKQYMLDDIVKYEAMLDSDEVLTDSQAKDYVKARELTKLFDRVLEYFGS